MIRQGDEIATTLEEVRPRFGNVWPHGMIIDYLTTSAWAMEPRTLGRLAELVQRWTTGISIGTQELDLPGSPSLAEDLRLADYPTSAATRGKKTEADERIFEIVDGSAIIPISGVIAKYARMVNGASQPRGTSVELVSEQLDAALGSERVRSIFLQIESPGGRIDGLADLADAIYAARQVKPVIAFADDMAASAAYWLGSQASRFYGTQSAEVGSIGVYTVAVDMSRRAADMGLKFNLIRSGPFKGTGVSGVEIAPEELAKIQTYIDSFFELFVSAVARGRAGKLSGEKVRELADGSLYIGAEAVEVGLLDGIKTLRQALTSAKPKPAAASVQAATISGDNEMTDEQKTQVAGIVVTDDDGKMVSEATGDRTSEEQTPAAGKTDPGAPGLALNLRPISAARRLETAAGIAAERQRIIEINNALAREFYSGLREAALAQGMSAEQAKAEALPIAEAELDKVAKELADLKAALNREGIKAVDFGASDETADPNEAAKTGGDDGKAETYLAAVAAKQAAGVGKADAMIDAGRELPKSHAAWKETLRRKDS